jgi:hypothetical protein
LSGQGVANRVVTLAPATGARAANRLGREAPGHML